MDPALDHVTFEDVFVYFSQDEWGLLDDAQKLLYRHVMLKNFALIASLGMTSSSPHIVTQLGQREESWVPDQVEMSLATAGAVQRGPGPGYWHGMEDEETSSEQNVLLGVSRARTPSAGPCIPKFHPYGMCGSTLKGIVPLTQYEGIKARQKLYMCGVCGKQFRLIANLHQHQKQHSREKTIQKYEGVDSVKTCMIYTPEKTYIYRGNGMDFPTTSNFLQQQLPPNGMKSHKNTEHMGTFHTGQKHHKCPECGESFSRKDTLVRHQRIHTGERPYECTECGKFFRQISSLIEHRRVHTGERLYKCSECGKFFSSKSNLIRHQEVHTGARPYVCGECGKEFNRKHTLVLHQRIHSGEKPYECSKCGKAFTQRPNLIRHWKIHTGERPYVCTICGKEFNRKHTLVLHQRIHIGEKP